LVWFAVDLDIVSLLTGKCKGTGWLIIAYECFVRNTDVRLLWHFATSSLCRSSSIWVLRGLVVFGPQIPGAFADYSKE
jgi:hypothetical protein